MINFKKQKIHNYILIKTLMEPKSVRYKIIQRKSRNDY